MTMADDRPTIEDILAQARAQDGGSAEEAAPVEEAVPVEAPETPTEDVVVEPVVEQPETPKASPAPSSVSDILAAARAQDAEGTATADDEKPAAAAEKPAAKTKPTGVSDILAAARAQDAEGDVAAADDQESAEPAPQAAPEPEPAASGDGERPNVQKMLQQLRQTDGATTDEDSDASAPRPMPTRPAAAAVPVASTTAPDDLSRRGMLAALLLMPWQLVATPFAAAWTALTAATAAMLLGLARFMFPNTLVEPPMTFKIGPPSDYPPDSVSAKFKAERGVWIVRSTMYNGQDQIIALASVCTHLGCTPNWLGGEQKFKCPCHGSGFYISGVNFEGPAPRPLERVGLTIAADGMLEVDKSRKFQDELGQWEDPASYVNA